MVEVTTWKGTVFPEARGMRLEEIGRRWPTFRQAVRVLQLSYAYSYLIAVNTNHLRPLDLFMLTADALRPIFTQ